MKLKIKKLILFLIAFAILTVSYAYFREWQMLGFPDGKISDFEHAMEIPKLAFSVISLMVGLCLISVGRLILDERINKYSFYLFTAFIGAYVLMKGLAFYFSSFLDAGGGG